VLLILALVLVICIGAIALVRTTACSSGPGASLRRFLEQNPQIEKIFGVLVLAVFLFLLVGWFVLTTVFVRKRQSTIDRYAGELYHKFDIRGAGVKTTAGSMSGGNMQKVVVAREFSFDTPVLVISQPTRGVDIGAMEFFHTRIIEKRNEGAAILLSSADLDEVFRLSDRIITLYEGKITGEFNARQITKEEIGLYMTGTGKGAEA
jgi:ABC-type uncharacterized transport system ATPase subunit